MPTRPGYDMSGATPRTDTGSGEIVLTVEEAADRLRVGRTTMYALVTSGAIRSVSIGRLRRIPVDALHEYVRGLMTAGPQPSAAA